MRRVVRGRGTGHPVRPIAPGRREGPALTRTLAVDIGGSGIKAGVLTEMGALLVSNEAGIRGGIALWGTRYDAA